jgi:multicomponent Na+:H+ antiporter subunit F
MNPVVDWMLGILGVSLLLVLVRLGRGPSLADRVLALDLLTLIGLSILALFSLEYAQPEFLDVAILLGLVGFIGSVAFSRALEASRGAKASDEAAGDVDREEET